MKFVFRLIIKTFGLTLNMFLRMVVIIFHFCVSILSLLVARSLYKEQRRNITQDNDSYLFKDEFKKILTRKYLQTAV